MPTPSDPRPAEVLAKLARSRGITDERVLKVMASVPRERFIPPEHRDEAALDAPVEIDCGQTISQPYIVALMTQQLALTGNERVLEIGTGSGYQTAILALLAGEVWTIERHELLSLRARSVLDGLLIDNVHYKVGDGTIGWPEGAPYDRILITAGAPSLPQTLFRQLRQDGLLVAPIGGEDEQELQVIRKDRGQPIVIASSPCRFVPLIGEEGW